MSLFGKRKPVLFLHLGLPGAGSREIQRTLLTHRAALAAAGVVYPTAGLRGPAHNDLAWACGFAEGGPTFR